MSKRYLQQTDAQSEADRLMRKHKWTDRERERERRTHARAHTHTHTHREREREREREITKKRVLPDMATSEPSETVSKRTCTCFGARDTRPAW